MGTYGLVGPVPWELVGDPVQEAPFWVRPEVTLPSLGILIVYADPGLMAPMVSV